MRKASSVHPRRSGAWIPGLLAASLVSLVVGALLAVSVEGWPRLVVAALGFAGYLFFFSRAFWDLLPRVVVEGDPDPERERANVVEVAAPRRERHSPAAA